MTHLTATVIRRLALSKINSTSGSDTISPLRPGPDAGDATEGQHGILDAFADCEVGIIPWLPMKRQATGKAGFKFHEVGSVLPAPPGHGRRADAAPFVEKQADVDVAIRTMIAAHSTSK